MKTHYELLGLEPAADADAVKKAFRREIARYHPDKVIHLGVEFQALAATRAAELTVAYKTLTDDTLRAEYDAGLAASAIADTPATPLSADTAPVPPEYRTPTLDDLKQTGPVGNPARFHAERADRDLILTRAIVARARASVEAVVGACETPAVRGFDLALVPLTRPRFLRTPPPRVLVRIVAAADAAAMTSAFGDALRAKVGGGKSPLVVLLCSRTIPAPPDLSKAWDTLARHRHAPGSPVELTVVVVDVVDWSCRLPPNCPGAARKLADRICVP